jgi:hemerythrin-like domain-containing protein
MLRRVDAIETMMHEHRLIEGVLAALDAYVVAVNRGQGFERADLGKFVSFFRDYADARHHGQEEKILFAAMQDHGVSGETGPLADLLHEHIVGRALISVLGDIAPAGKDWPADAPARITDAASRFGRLLRQHIDKEDVYLYPMARETLPESIFNAVTAECHRVAQQHMTSSSGARLDALANDLIARYI